MDQQASTNPVSVLDRYELRHLAAHLIAAGRHGDLHRVLTMEVAGEAMNAWFAAHDEADDLAGYLDDLALATSAARATTLGQINRGQLAVGVALEYGYALISASINTLAGQIPSWLRIALLRHGKWSPQRALADMKRLPPSERPDELVRLAPHLPVPEADRALGEAFEAARAIVNERERARALSGLAEGLPERLMGGALEQARAISDADVRAGLLPTLADRLSGKAREAVLAEAFTAVRAISEEDDRHKRLVAIMERLPDGEHEAALRAMLPTDEPARTQELRELVWRLPVQLQGVALEPVREITDEYWRAVLLSELGDRLSGKHQEAALGALLDTIRASGDISFLDKWASQLPERRVGEAFKLVSEQWYEARRTSLLGSLVDRLSGNEREAALADWLRVAGAREREYERYRTAELRALIARVPERLMGELFELVRANLVGALNDPNNFGRLSFDHQRLLDELMEYVPEQLMGEVLELVRALNEFDRGDVLDKLVVERVPERWVGEVLELVRASRVNPVRRTKLLGLLADRLSGKERQAALADALKAARTGSHYQRATALAVVSDWLTGDAREAALAAALKYAPTGSPPGSHYQSYQWAQALAVVSDRLTGDAREAALDRAFDCMLVGLTKKKIRNFGWPEHIETLNMLAERLPERLAVRALEQARAISDADVRAGLLSTLAGRLSGKAREAVLAEALKAAHAVERSDARDERFVAIIERLPDKTALRAVLLLGEPARTQVLDKLVRDLPERLVGVALEPVRALPDEHERATLLGVLADRCSGDAREAALAAAFRAARAIKDESRRARLLLELADRCSGDAQEAALAAAFRAARAIKDESRRAQLLLGLADRCSGDAREAALGEAFDATLAITSEHDRAMELRMMINRLPERSMDETLEAAGTFADEKNRSWVLAAHDGRLSERHLGKAVAVARQISDEGPRAQSMAALCGALSGTEREAAVEEVLRTLHRTSHTISDYKSRMLVLTALPGPLPERLMAEVLTEVRAIPFADNQIEILIALTERVSDRARGSVLAETVKATSSMLNSARRDQVIGMLAEHSPEWLLDQALAAARAIDNEYSRAHALAALAKYLPARLVGEALAAARAIDNEYSRTLVLAALAEKLPSGEREAALAEAVAIARAIPEVQSQPEALGRIAQYLPNDEQKAVLREALETVRSIEHADDRCAALGDLAPFLPADQLEKALDKALTEIGEIGDVTSQSEAFEHLAEWLPGRLMLRALKQALAIDDQGSRAEVLAIIADKLPGRLIGQALEATQAITDQSQHPRILRGLAHGLPVHRFEQLLDAAHSLRDENDRTTVLDQLTGRLIDAGVVDPYPRWTDLLAHAATCDRPHLLSSNSLARLIPILGGTPATREAWHWIQRTGRWWP